MASFIVLRPTTTNPTVSPTESPSRFPWGLIHLAAILARWVGTECRIPFRPLGVKMEPRWSWLQTLAGWNAQLLTSTQPASIEKPRRSLGWMKPMMEDVSSLSTGLWDHWAPTSGSIFTELLTGTLCVQARVVHQHRRVWKQEEVLGRARLMTH